MKEATTGFVIGWILMSIIATSADNHVNKNDTNIIEASTEKCSSFKGVLVEYDMKGELVCDVNGVEITTTWN